MEKPNSKPYLTGFIPYALAAFLIGIIGGFTAVLGPAFVKDIGLDYNNTTWTALAMSISTAAFAPILGRLSDTIGRRVTLLLGILIFILGNVMTALSQSLVFMLAARFVVGIGSAAIAPAVIAYIVGEFPSDKISGGFSLYMLISSAAVIFGPTLGGLVINNWGWRVMMWICVAISATVFFACLLISKEKKRPKKELSSFDGLGSVFVLIFFSLTLCIPSFGQNFGWGSAAFVFVLISAVISLVILILVERKAKAPVLQGIIKLSDQPYTALLKINVGIKDQYISLVFPIEIDLTPEAPIRALSFLYMLEHNKFYFSANETYWGNYDIAHNCESNFILLEQPNKLDEKTLIYDTTLIPGALCKGDPLWQP